MRLGVLTGSVLPSDVSFDEMEFAGTSSGIGRIYAGEDEILIIARHGHPPRLPPHRIDHASNIKALKESGVECVISICSTGSLDSSMQIPSYLIPDDYIDLFSGSTVVQDSILHVTPSFDPTLRKAVLGGFERCGIGVVDGGVYIQTNGPRLETRAEIRMLSSFGDVVGMNLGSECTVSCEMGIPFAGINTVDNYANGVVDQTLDYRDIISSAEERWNDLRNVLIEVLDILNHGWIPPTDATI